MNEVLRATIVTLVVALIVGFFACLGLALFTAPTRDLGQFLWDWVWAQTVATFLDNFVVICCAAILMGYSLFIKPGTARTRFADLVGGTIVLYLVLTLAFALAYELVRPAAVARRDLARTSFLLYEDWRSRAEQAERAGLYDEARLFYRYLQHLEPRRTEWQERLRAMESFIAKAGRSLAPTHKPPTASSLIGLPVTELTARARRFLDDGDPYSAQFYAGLAVRIDDQDGDARRAKAEAEAQIASRSPGPEEAAKRKLFDEKAAALELYNVNDYVGAFDAFTELFRRHPRDPEVRDFLAKSKAALGRSSFFMDEMEQLEALPSGDDGFFLNSASEGGREFVSFARIVRASSPLEATSDFRPAADGVYFFDVEVAGLDPRGELVYHYKAKYGKIVSTDPGTTLSLRCLVRGDPTKVNDPIVLKGRPRANPITILRLNFTPDELFAISEGSTHIDRSGAAELWNVRAVYERAAYPRQPVEEEILIRVLAPASFMSLALLSMAYGWRYRSRQLGIPLISIFAGAVGLPLVTLLVVHGYLLASRVILGFVLYTYGFGPAAAALAGMQGGLLVLALVYLARQQAD